MNEALSLLQDYPKHWVPVLVLEEQVSYISKSGLEIWILKKTSRPVY